MLSLSGSDSINSILGNDQYLFEVPLYQRRYVWDETNWNKLWEDIVEQVNIPPNQRGVGHFTGPIVTRIIDERAEDRRQRFEVIDGQQRLTTLEIIFCVIRDLCSGVPSLKNDSAVKAAKDHVMSSDDDHKLILTKYDKPTFEKIIEEKYGRRIHRAFNVDRNCLVKDKVKEVRSELLQLLSGEEKVSDSILGAYNYFYKKVRNHIKIDTQKVSGLLFTITSNFKLIHLSLVGTEDAEKVFESINATGRMLSNFDYLRNNLFLRARKLGIDEEENKFYRDIYYDNLDYWPFEKDWKAEELESFLKAFIEVTRPPECLKKENAKPFEEYLEYSKYLESKYPQDEDKIPFEFKELARWAGSYQRLQKDHLFTDFENFRKDLSLLGLGSFLLFVMHHEKEPQWLFHYTVSILESYIMRSLLVLENATCSHADIKVECYKNIESFFDNVVKHGQDFCTESFVDFLINNSDIEDEAVLSAFDNVENKNAEFIAYVLNRINNWVLNPRTLSWEEHVDLITEIRKRLGDSTGLMDEFNQLWPALSTFR